MIKDYKGLIVWQKSFLLSLAVYRVTAKLPKSEVYGLVSQMRRAAVAMPSNIAEGYSRKYRAEYLQFLRIAFSSGAELETQLLIAKELKYVEFHEYGQINDLLIEVIKMLSKMIKVLGGGNRV
jgi:four helix bundle protein